MLSEFQTKLASLRDELRRVSKIAEAAGEQTLAAEAVQRIERIAGRPFQIAVVGEFKSGKSTLINALVGEAILPASTRECTAVVTILRSPKVNEKPGVTATLENGAICEIDLQ